MLEGLMQHDRPLTTQFILERLRTVNGDATLTTLRSPDESTAVQYREIAGRVDQLCCALASLGVTQGERVATLSWNTQEHFEAYLAVPSMGAVLHTLNLRLSSDQLAYVINHGGARTIIVDESLIELLTPITDQLDNIEHYVVIGDAISELLPNAIRYEDLLAAQPAGFEYPALDDRQAAGLCYTSGTTGNPKGVLYSHKSNVLQTLVCCMVDGFGISSDDCILPVVPMFHANGWCLSYAAGLVGANLVMPGAFVRPEPLARLIENERVTFAAAVPTVWMDLLRYVDSHETDLASLRVVYCGGAAVPLSLMEAFEERHGVSIVQAWGMTETSPLGAVARPPRDSHGSSHWNYRTSAGRPVPLIEARITHESGEPLPWDNEATGELEVRGPFVASGYYNDDSDLAKFHDGWLRTGDVASISPDGYIRIADRAKDVIKSGGEWISSVELENLLMAHADVIEAAVIAMPDARWQERPLACVVVDKGADVPPVDLAEFLSDKVAKWWVPDAYAFIEMVPKTSVGKFDKKELRRQLAADELRIETCGALQNNS